jgi:aminoglycoside phosphotransferase (APT) family kinase protein
VELIGKGRAADVYDIGGGRVLRRYRDPHPGITEKEARVMAHAAAHGFPVPTVHDHTDSDLVMDRVDGPSMLTDVGRRPWRFRPDLLLLVGLHEQLAAIPAVDGLAAPLGEGDRLLHLDLHPDNVLLGRDGPVVIDWTNAARGPAGADAAYTWVIAATSDVEGAVAKAAKRLFTARFRALARPPAELVPACIEQRLADRNVTPAEQERLRRLAAKR